MQMFAELSDDDLVSLLQACCREMRRAKVRVLALLADVEQRRIHPAST